MIKTFQYRSFSTSLSSEIIIAATFPLLSNFHCTYSLPYLIHLYKVVKEWNTMKMNKHDIFQFLLGCLILLLLLMFVDCCCCCLFVFAIYHYCLNVDVVLLLVIDFVCSPSLILILILILILLILIVVVYLELSMLELLLIGYYWIKNHLCIELY